MDLEAAARLARMPSFDEAEQYMIGRFGESMDELLQRNANNTLA